MTTIKCALCWDNVPESDAIYGTAWQTEGNICKECIEYVGPKEFHAYESIASQNNSYAYTSVSDWDWTTYQDVWSTPGSAYKYQPCSHHMVPFTFESKNSNNSYTVHLTGSSSLKSTPTVSEMPTVGVYLDDGWFQGRLASNTSHDLDLSQPATLYVGWPDLGVINVDILSQAVGWTLPYMHNKQDIIEIACIGGHGRTGTFLGALMITEGWSVADATKYIHENHCSKAIETLGQEDLLVAYYKLLHGEANDESGNQQLCQTGL